MSTNTRPTGSAPATSQKSLFEQQRELLLKEIGVSFEHVLHNINKFNRSLEGVIAVGNEFSSVEALWSSFENIMAKDPNAETEGSAGEDGREEGEEEITELPEQRNR